MRLSAKVKVPSKKQEWYYVRDRFWIAWCLAFSVLGIVQGGVALFGAGLNFGLAFEKIANRKLKRMIEAHRRQDFIDLRTMADLSEKMSYDMLHKMDKSGMN